MDFSRLYEFRNICDDNKNPIDHYFHNFDWSIIEGNRHYTRLANEINRLDSEAWKFLKQECIPDLYQTNNNRGWSQFFSKLNEAKGYGYLLDQGCHTVKFIPTSKENGVETPDLKGFNGAASFLCEVKTINRSDCEIYRRKEGSDKEVCYELNDGLKSQLEKIINKAKSQLKNHLIAHRIIYIVIFNDDWQPEAQSKIKTEISLYINCLLEDGVEIKIDLA